MRSNSLNAWQYALLMDLADVGGNVKDGCHIAACGGSWMAAVYGFAGMRDRDGELSFDPRPYLERLRFALTVRGQRLEVRIENGVASYQLRGTAELTIHHRGERLVLREGEPITRELAEVPETLQEARERDPRRASPPSAGVDQHGSEQKPRQKPTTPQSRGAERRDEVRAG